MGDEQLGSSKCAEIERAHVAVGVQKQQQPHFAPQCEHFAPQYSQPHTLRIQRHIRPGVDTDTGCAWCNQHVLSHTLRSQVHTMMQRSWFLDTHMV